MVNFHPLAAEMVSGVWGTPATFNGFRVLAALFMVALCNRADHIYFHPVVSFYLLLSFFIPRLISAVGDWMSAILPHMVWP